MNEGAALAIQPSRAQKHSRFGIASFIVSLILGVAHFLNLAIAGFLVALSPEGMDSRSLAAIIIGFAMCGLLLLNLLGLGLGIAGLFERERKKVFSILGAILNVGLIVGIVALVAVGLMFPE